MPLLPLRFEATIDEEGVTQFSVADGKRLAAFHLWTVAAMLQALGDDMHRKDVEMREDQLWQQKGPGLVIAPAPLPRRQ